jgi:general secretion pathway protein G
MKLGLPARDSMIDESNSVSFVPKGFWRNVLILICLSCAIIYAILPRCGRSPMARITRAQTEITAFSTACDAFRMDVGYYPTRLDDLLQKPSGASNWLGPYLVNRTTGALDPWGNAFVYRCPGLHNPQTFDISSLGPDGIPDTDDDVCNWTR